MPKPRTVWALIALMGVMAGPVAADLAANEWIRVLRREGSALVPLRYLGEWLEARVDYESRSRTITLTMQDRVVTLRVGSAQATVDGRPFALARYPLVEEGVTYVPLRFVGEALGAEVDWDPWTEWVTLTHPRREEQLLLPSWETDRLSALHVEARSGLVNRVAARLDRGADPDTRDDLEATPSAAAIEWGQTAVVRLLLERGADPNARLDEQSTALHTTARENQPQSALMLLQAGAQIEAQDIFGDTALHRAAYDDRLQVARVLLEAGANPNAGVGQVGTPLHQAALIGQLHSVELLLGHGAAANARDEHGLTPLHLAAGYAGGHPAVVKLLLARGADLNAEDGEGLTPLDLARLADYDHVVELLRQHGADQ